MKRGRWILLRQGFHRRKCYGGRDGGQDVEGGTIVTKHSVQMTRIGAKPARGCSRSLAKLAYNPPLTPPRRGTDRGSVEQVGNAAMWNDFAS